MSHPDLLQRFPLKIIGCKNWVQKLLEVVKTPNRPNQRPKIQLSSTRRLVGADENVDADQTSTERPVSGQPTGLFTQREDIDIDFRVSGLPHAVVKRAENFHVRELVKKIESHPHREPLHADLQQNNVCNPIKQKFESDDS